MNFLSAVFYRMTQKNKSVRTHHPANGKPSAGWHQPDGFWSSVFILQRILRTHSYFSTSPMFLFCYTIFIPTLRGETRGYIFFHEFYCLLLGERHKLFIQRFIGHQIDCSIELILWLHESSVIIATTYIQGLDPIRYSDILTHLHDQLTTEETYFPIIYYCGLSCSESVKTRCCTSSAYVSYRYVYDQPLHFGCKVHVFWRGDLLIQ